jgi:hypothetical protein
MSKRAKAPKSPGRRRGAARPARRTGAPKRAKPRTSSAGLERKLEQRTRELDEALERQAATAEILRVISSSPGELEPVFQTILENARQICRANYATVFLYENELLRPVAQRHLPATMVAFHCRRGPFRPAAGTGLDRLIRTKQVVTSPTSRPIEPRLRLRPASPGRAPIWLCRCSKKKS